MGRVSNRLRVRMPQERAVRLHVLHKPVSVLPYEDRPVSWYDLLSRIEQDLAAQAQRMAGKVKMIDIFFGWHPNLRVMLRSLTVGHLLYLCWGFPSQTSGLGGRVKRRIFEILLKRADVLVNDPLTYREVEAICGRPPRRVSGMVDTEFFACEEGGSREELFLVPGNNGRNEELVAHISRHIKPVVRVTSSREVQDYYENSHRGCDVSLAVDVSYRELRSLYQRAKAVLIPLEARHHAAGQTSLLEAVAAGAPVVISDGRAARTLSNVASVIRCQTDFVETWLSAIDRARLVSRNLSVLKQGAEYIRRNHSPGVVRVQIESILADVVQ